ncbi:hypothetical protein AZF37_04890 [endosymbiont 'TC1' of Trimyema compressum]|uniref:hypothetical protein n=1 Tax=endosymbiont 'TC1' of Trimyema compressum TaxID=243899 RepID=UPI0007F12A2D|nr:hypothetical protein [endosymbiont 'TC1' of Trimyema compressum]AMP20596.1 hypothetical protein AZF37_04890 [endosymbiont 'TC1' of Trimyema compressum]
MEILKGKKIIELLNFKELLSCYSEVLIDIGTGNGRYPYQYAKKNPNSLAIGIDPAGNNMMIEYSVKSQRKPSKGGLDNVLYCVAAIESIPEELADIGDKITVNLPWGSLLEGIVKGENFILNAIVKMAKKNCSFRAVFSYTELHESGEIERRTLPELSTSYIENTLIPYYNNAGIIITEIKLFSNEDLRKLNTLWAKKLMVSKKRDIYSIEGFILKAN